MKTAVITGASRGIGRAALERFLENGDFVIGTSTSGELPMNSDNLLPLRLDLANPESIAACVQSISDSGKRIDILINNAGIWSGDEEELRIRMNYLRTVLEVNLFGTVDFTEQVIPFVNIGGHIVNVSSRMGSLQYTGQGGKTNCPDYRISKAALNMVTKTLAIRLNGEIAVSSVHPGWVKTDMGGSDADIEPQEAAEEIFKLANSKVETGQFWFNGKKFPW